MQAAIDRLKISQDQLLLQGKFERQKEISCSPSSAQPRETKTFELRFFVMLVMAGEFTGDELTLFFLTTVTQSPSEKFSPITMDE
jgi:hypothetical protein